MMVPIEHRASTRSLPSAPAVIFVHTLPAMAMPAANRTASAASAASAGGARGVPGDAPAAAAAAAAARCDFDVLEWQRAVLRRCACPLPPEQEIL